MSITIGHVRGGQVVLDGDGDPLPEGSRVTIIIEDEAAGFHVDDASQGELLDAVREVEEGQYVTHQELFKRLKQLK